MFTAALAVVVEHQVPSAGEAAGLVALTTGVMLAVYEGSGAAGPFAVFLCVLGTVCNAAMMTFSGKLLSEKIDVLRLAFYTAPVSLLVLLPFLWMREARPAPTQRARACEAMRADWRSEGRPVRACGSARQLVPGLDEQIAQLDGLRAGAPRRLTRAARAQASSLHRYMTLHGFDVVVIILLSSGVALSYNVVHSLMIQHTSAVATTVIGEVRTSPALSAAAASLLAARPPVRVPCALRGRGAASDPLPRQVL